MELGFFSFLLNGFNGIFGFFMRSLISWFKDWKIKETLTEKTRSLELEMIKLKLDPHFLFNTINNVDVLLETDSVKANTYLHKLASILRFYLYKTSETLILLSDEIKYIDEYVELQKIRTANKDFVQLMITGKIKDKKIPPMTLIPFIENAFKHSPNKKTSTIEINLNIEKNELHFTCKNPLVHPNETKNKEKGVGIELTEKRLKLIYGNQHHLIIKETLTDYFVELRIPI